MKSDDRWLQATVEAADDLSPTVRQLLLRPAGGVQPWSVGSHLRVQVRIDDRADVRPEGRADVGSDGRREIRHYSLVGLPPDSHASGCYRIAVKRAEPGRGGSRFMAALQPGDALAIAGPDNHFELPLSAPFTLLVAGGIGITPIVGMALTLAARNAPLRMVYGARSDDELVFADVLRSALGDRLQTLCDARGQRLQLDAEIAGLPPRAQLLICGPTPLLQAAQAAWAAAGRRPADLRFETFGSSGNRAAEAFWVRLAGQALQFDVPADRTLLDVLADNGIEMLSDCRRGECGLCAVDIVDVQGQVDHRDVFFSAAQQREAKQLCACVSRVCGGGVVIDTGWRPDEISVPRAAPPHAAAA